MPTAIGPDDIVMGTKTLCQTTQETTSNLPIAGGGGEEIK